MYRSHKIFWRPRNAAEAFIATEARREAGRLWSDLVTRHNRIRRLHWKWPEKARWFKWAKGCYPGLYSQSIQQIITDFVDALNSTTMLRKSGRSEARYPWKKPRYHDIIYTNQSAVIRNGYLQLPNGKSGRLKIRIPKTLILQGRLMEARLSFGYILLIHKLPDDPKPTGPTIGVDLGINTLIAASDDQKTVLVSGREIKATIQWRNKKLASLSSKQSSTEKLSRRNRRLQRRKRKLLAKAGNRINDLIHKATRKVADEFPNANAFVGKAFNGAAKRASATQAQQISQACCGKITRQLDYKLSTATKVSEAYSSQTCPVCGCRHRCRRVYKCTQCGFVGPRDQVGSINIRAIGLHDEMRDQPIPQSIKYLRPRCRSSSGGSPASSLLVHQNE